ncbi:LAGLIDADG family homing endonuclease [Oceanobacillus sp. FSL H7-0719]|uniref:LAGLIDADG family homing endonuclease n=1 Tax=Oceanobacillus sp. FSL H7-0719 TaxID=2954507 RepID=UPI003245287B
MTFEWLNEHSKHFLESGYLEEGVTPKQRIREVADNAEKILGIKGFSDKFYDYMGKGYYSLSSPVWANFGNKRGLPISCYSVDVQDNFGDIMRATGEVGMMSKLGGGTGGFFGKLRPRGAKITGNGESSGAVHFVELFESLMDVATQGSVRRGAFSPYLPVDHPDIEEFLKIGTEGNPIQKLTHAVTVTDEWMQQMIDGDADKRKIWAEVLQRRVEMGYPYILFKDTVNNNTVDVYKDKGLEINHSNLCVAPETKILTDQGYETIGSLDGEKVNVWNGEEWSKVEIIKTGENQELLRVITDSGYELESTPYHKFYVLENTDSGKRTKPPRYKEVRAQDLRIGDKLIKFDLPVIEGHKILQHAYDNGFLTADGTMSKNAHIMYLYDDKQDLIDNFTSVGTWVRCKTTGRLQGRASGLKDKYFVPTTDYTISSKLEWLSGYLDGDGTVTNNNGSQSIQVASINKEFLKNVQLMLQTLGVDSKVSLARKAGASLLPKNDGTGDYAKYKTQEVYRLLINGNSLYKLHKLGFETHRLQWEVRKPNREASHFIQVTDIQQVKNRKDTYCFTEPKRHMGMFNGLLTGQCSEIALPTNEEWSFVCCLSSMNLLHYDEWKDTDAVETLTYFLDAVMEEFITKLEGMRDSNEKEEQQAFYFMEKAYKFAKTNRALGIGVLGWHSYLQSNMIPFESIEASRKNIEIFRLLKEKTYKASGELAQVFGEPELLKGYGRRNSTLIAPAPTTSSAFILGQVSQSIEPLFSNSYVKDLAKTKITVRNPYLKDVLAGYGKDDRETWSSIRDYDGSVQHLDFLTEHEKNVFKTFSEIDQYAILDQAAMRQQFIDQSQSLNLMINPNTSAKEINNLYIFAWQNGIKTLYYQHGTNAAQQFNKDLNCIMCEA